MANQSYKNLGNVLEIHRHYVPVGKHEPSTNKFFELK